MNNNFEFFEKKHYNDFEPNDTSVLTRHCINGTTVGCSKCVGYCRFNQHPGFVTEQLRKDHGCIEKKCNYYIAKPLINRKRRTNSSLDYSTAILRIAQRIIDNNCGVRVIRVNSTNENNYQAFFVTITNEYNFDNCIREISKQFSVNIHFIRLDYDYDVSAQLLFAV